MARLARFQFVVADPTTGLPVAGASVEVRSQGATVNGDHAGANTSFTVNNPGAVVATNTTVIDATSTPTRAVASHTATNVTVAATGFTDIDDDQRISIALPLPTLYNDASGDESKTNPLTTDANGLVECWIVGSNFDVLVSKSGTLTTTLYEDVATVGGEEAKSNVYNSGVIPAWVLDSLRTLVDGQPLLSLRNAGTDKHRFFADGSWRSVKGGTIDAGGLTITGGGLTATDNSTITGTLGVTALTAVSVTLTNDLSTRYIKLAGGAQIVAGDFALSAGFGSTSSVVPVGAGTDTMGRVAVVCTGSGQGANPTITLTFSDGGFVGIDPLAVTTRTSTGDQVTVPFLYASGTATTLVWQFRGTPVNGETYEFVYFIASRT